MLPARAFPVVFAVVMSTLSNAKDVVGGIGRIGGSRRIDDFRSDEVTDQSGNSGQQQSIFDGFDG
jgi:hypothetical protein